MNKWVKVTLLGAFVLAVVVLLSLPSVSISHRSRQTVNWDEQEPVPTPSVPARNESRNRSRLHSDDDCKSVPKWTWKPKHCLPYSTLPTNLRGTNCAMWGVGEWEITIQDDDDEGSHAVSEDCLVATAVRKAKSLVRFESFASGGSVELLTNVELVLVLHRYASRGIAESSAFFSSSLALAKEHATLVRPIVFLGDSLVRQLFNRLVFFLRGQRSNLIEHYFHCDAQYVITKRRSAKSKKKSTNRNGDAMIFTDRLRISCPDARPVKFVDCSATDDEACVLDVRFLWDENFYEARMLQAQRSASPDPISALWRTGKTSAAVVFQSHAYWWILDRNVHSAAALDPHDYTKKFLELLPHSPYFLNTNTGVEKRAFVLLLPPLLPEANQRSALNKRLMERSRLAKEWCDASALLSEHSDGLLPDGSNGSPVMNVRCFDFASLADRLEDRSKAQDAVAAATASGAATNVRVQTKRRRCDNIHFMCGYEPAVPQQVQRIKRDCGSLCDEDEVNLVGIQAMVALLIHGT